MKEMSSRAIVKTIPIGILSSVVFSLFLISSAHAQTTAPQFLVTWKTSGSYVPAAYPGKALPTYGSQITATVELVSGGKILNIKNQTIYWFLNGTPIGGGAGVQRVTFPPFDVPPNALTLRVELPSYKGQLLLHDVLVQTIKPRVVIYAPYPGGTTGANPITVQAIPYFFNTSSPSNLSFAWSVNGQGGAAAENPDEAQIALPPDTPSGTSLAVSLTVKNPADSSEAAASTNIIYQKQL